MFGHFTRSSRSGRRLAFAVVASSTVAVAYTFRNREVIHASAVTTPPPSAAALAQPLMFAPTRDESVAKLKKPGQIYDLLIIGGGATGSGIALDATMRGLTVALVEAEDFSAGASSRSTKLIHGGIRYLQKAFTQLDKGQYTLVQEALTERKHLLSIAPHLARSFPIIVPIYGTYPTVLFWGPYYWAGCKMYDLVAGKKAVLEPSYWISKSAAMEKFPMLKSENLHGGVVYYDGQQNDTRMNVAIVLTAAAHGATIANHVRVTDLLKDSAGVVSGAKVEDRNTGETFTIAARQTINATGPMSDHIRKMADPSVEACITPSAGIHITLPPSYTPPDMGLIVPETSDGRVLFLLPWEGSTIAGTTDYLSEITPFPKPHEEDVQFLIREVSTMLAKPISREDVKSAWSGIRPLARDTKAKDTQSVSRDHMIEHTSPGLLTIAGGKWTTYRKMAEDLVNTVVKDHSKLADSKNRIDVSQLKPCATWCYPVIGSHHYTPELVNTLQSTHKNVTPELARHLVHNYGDRAPMIVDIANQENLISPITEGFPFIKAEVIYACRYEFATSAVDVIAHRTRISFLDSIAASKALPNVVDLMAKHFKWDSKKKSAELQKGKDFLSTMNLAATTQAINSTTKPIDQEKHRADHQLKPQ